MTRFNCQTQSGYALIIFVLMMMGVGGIVIGGFTQQVKKDVEFEKFLHNKRVLKQAKQALLQFAYNYPVTNQNGPGRLPCPDTDNNGAPNAVINCSTFLGRLPWNQQNLNLYDIRDAAGQRLWYAVSKNFSTQEATPLNSSATRTITLRDQAGNIIFDASANNGIAAVIIAPGAETARNGVPQDRSVGNGDDPFDTLADTDPGIINAANYLDQLVGTEDNAAFVQDTTNGFILGPVDNLTAGSVIINDQFIVITAQEVIEVAEKATLQAYRTAINDYLNVARACAGGAEDNEADCIAGGGSWNSVYPWLYNYVDVADVAGLSSYFPADADFNTELITNLGNFGRIPSTFSDYFTQTASQPIESALSGSLTLNDGGGTVDFYQEFKGGNPDVATLTFAFNDAPTLDFLTAQKLTNVGFSDIGGNNGRLSATFPGPESIVFQVYFWDEDNSVTGFWTVCPSGADELSDCNRDNVGNPTPGSPTNGLMARILHLTVTLDFDGVVNFDADYSTAPTIAPIVAATNTSHAWITATYATGAIVAVGWTLSATYEFERHYHDGDSSLDVNNNTYATGTVEMDDFVQGPVVLGMRYYPVLPRWVFTNNWHNSLMMAYANDYRPDVNGAAGDCAVNAPCLVINGLAGTNNDKVSILALAGEHIWVDGDVNPAVAIDGSFENEVGDVFNNENSDLDNVFDIRTLENTAAPGDARLDKILVIE